MREALAAVGTLASPSAWREWIEMLCEKRSFANGIVSLRLEGVD